MSDRTEARRQIGDRIRKLRSNQGWSQQELAERLEVTPQTINRYENGKVEIARKKLRGVAEVFGTSVAALLGTDEMVPLSPVPSATPTTASMWLSVMEYHLNRAQLYAEMQRKLIDDIVTDLQAARRFMSAGEKPTGVDLDQIQQELVASSMRARELLEALRVQQENTG